MSTHQDHRDGICLNDCPVCEYEEAQPTTLYANDDADNTPTIWAQTGDRQPRAVLRLTALEPDDDRETHWQRIVDALEDAQRIER